MQHHRLPELKQLEKRYGIEVRVSCISYKESQLLEKEKFFINTLKPKINNTPIL